MEDWRDDIKRLYEEKNEKRQRDESNYAATLDAMATFINDIAYPAFTELGDELAQYGRTATLYHGHQFARISVELEQRTEMHFEIHTRASTKGIVYWYTRITGDETGKNWKTSDKRAMGLLDRPVLKTTKEDVIETFIRAYQEAINLNK